jgi:hypothetical protein
MTKVKNHQWWNWKSTQDTDTLIKDAFERPETDGWNTSWWDKKVPIAIKEGVWETWKRVVDVIKDL